MLLNAMLGGQRRCVLVTNNEVDASTARRLAATGVYRGDPAFEAEGIFESVTRPRVTAAVMGHRADRTTLKGNYIGGGPLAAGFPENIEFFRLEYLDPASVELGRAFDSLLPVWWLQAGSRGERAPVNTDLPFAVPVGGSYAFLFDPSGMAGLLAQLAQRPSVTHVFVVADSEDAFADVAEQIPSRYVKTLLYRPYLDLMRGLRA